MLNQLYCFIMIKLLSLKKCRTNLKIIMAQHLSPLGSFLTVGIIATGNKTELKNPGCKAVIIRGRFLDTGLQHSLYVSMHLLRNSYINQRFKTVDCSTGIIGFFFFITITLC